MCRPVFLVNYQSSLLLMSLNVNPLSSSYVSFILSFNPLIDFPVLRKPRPTAIKLKGIRQTIIEINKVFLIPLKILSGPIAMAIIPANMGLIKKTDFRNFDISNLYFLKIKKIKIESAKANNIVIT